MRCMYCRWLCCSIYVQNVGSFVKEPNVRVTYQGGGYSVPYPVDNSDSPSVVEQSQQGISFSCISFIIPFLQLCGVSYALCLLPSLMQCCLNMILWLSWSLGIPLMELSCLVVPCLMQLSLSKDFGVCSPFYLGCFLLHPGMVCLG